jgi:hypothetical protein
MDSPTESRTSYSLAVVAVGVALVSLFAGAAVILAVGRSVPQEMWAAASALSGALVGILIPTPGRGAAAPDPVAAGANVSQAASLGAARSAAATITQDPQQPDGAKQAAMAAVAAVKAAPVDAKVAQVRASSTPTEVVDEVIAIFAGLLSGAEAQVRTAQTDQEADAQDGPDAPALETELAKAQATQTVHAAAAAAATESRGIATEIAAPAPSPPASALSVFRSIGWTIAGAALAFVVLVGAFVVALLVSKGTIHAVGCPIASAGKTQGCDSNLLQVGTALLSLASAGGGTLLGLFATPDGKPAAPKTGA